MLGAGSNWGWVDPSGCTEEESVWGYLYMEKMGILWKLTGLWNDSGFYFNWYFSTSDCTGPSYVGSVPLWTRDGYFTQSEYQEYAIWYQGLPKGGACPDIGIFIGEVIFLDASSPEAQAILAAATSEPPAPAPEPTPEPSDPAPTPEPERPDKRIEARGPYPIIPPWGSSLPRDKLAKLVKAVDDGLGEIPGVKPHEPKGRLAKIASGFARLMYMYLRVIPVVPEFSLPG